MSGNQLRNLLLLVGIPLAAVTVVLALYPPVGVGMLVLVVGAIVILISFRRPTIAYACALAIGLTAGFTRRVLDFYYPGSAFVSFLVVLPALIIATIWISTLGSGRWKGKRRLPIFFVLTLVAVVIGGVNPAGSGISSNLLTSMLLFAGLLSFPLAFNGVVRADAILLAVLLVGILNSAYIIQQTIWGLTPWDSFWVTHSGYSALYLGPDEVRPLGLSSSAAESSALSAAVVAIGVWLFRGKRNPLFLLAAGIGLYATAVSGTRTFMILAILAICVAVAAGRRRPIFSFVAILVVAVPLVVVLSSLFISDASTGASRTLTTLSGNEDLETSSIPIHVDIAVGGLLKGLSSVIGTGSGQLGILAGTGLGSAETDVANVTLMAGIIGLVAVIGAYWAFVRYLPGLLRSRSAAIGFAIVLVGSFGQWFNVGFYGMTPFIWMAFGAFIAAGEDGANALGDSGKGRRDLRIRRSEPIRTGTD